MKYKKILASVLALAMIVGLVPGMVFAEETEDQDLETVDTVETVDEVTDEQEEEVTEETTGEPAEIRSDAEEQVYAGSVDNDSTDYAKLYFGDLTADGTYLVTQPNIKLEHDVDTNGRIVIPKGATVTIDLNQHEIDRGLYFDHSENGGGIFGVQEGAKLIVTNGKLVGGNRIGNGGGFNVLGELELDNVKVFYNKCTEAGGAIYLNGGSFARISDCEIYKNESTGRGAGIYVDGDSTLVIEDTKIYNNEADSAGGGIHVNGNNGDVTVTLRGTCELKDNKVKDDASSPEGGAIYMDGDSTVAIRDNCTISGNRAISLGAGIAVMDQSSLTITGNCLFDDNHSYRGASVFVEDGCFFNISGKIQMFSYKQSCDLALCKEAKIHLIGKLDEGSKIRVDYEGAGSTAFTSGYGTYHGEENPSKYFSAHSIGNCVFADNGEVFVGCYYYDRTWDSATNTITKTRKEVRNFELMRYVKPSEDGYYDLGDKWYFVDIETTLDKPVRCFLDTKIILSSTLTCEDGILVENGNSLNIYTDNDEDEDENEYYGMHKLVVNVKDSDRAGIETRNTDSTSAGTLNLFSGCVDVTGGSDAASIGGGEGADGGNFNIYGGFARAFVTENGAGIGGGEDASGGNINIYGGRVRVFTLGEEETYGAGIGGGKGSNASAGAIRIYGGIVVSNGAYGAAGIGCGKYGSGGSIYVYGGDILGKCSYGGNGVGCGDEGTGTVKVVLDYGTNGLKFRAVSFHGVQLEIKKPLTDGTNNYDPGLYSNVGPLEDKTLVSCLFTGFSLLLDGQIGLNYFVYLPAEMIEGQVVKFTWTVNGVQKEFSHTVTASDLTEKGYKITCPMNAPEMTRDVTLTVSVYGEPVSCETSVAGYAKYLLSNEYKASYVAEYGQDKYNKLAYLVKTMLDYGAKGQTKFSIDADNLANTDLDYTMKNVTSDMVAGLLDPSAVPDMSTGLDAYGLKYAGSAVVYMSKTSLRLFYKITDADKFDLVKDSVTFDGNQVFYVVSGNRVYFELENISAANLDHRYTLKIGESEYEFSALDYVRSCLDYSDQIDAAMLDLAKATYWYCKAANDFIEGA